MVVVVVISSVCVSLTSAASDLEWVTLDSAPGAMGEVGGAVVNDVLYIFGFPDAKVNAFDLVRGRWRALNATAPRLYADDHHSVQSFRGKLYVLGGLRGGSEGKVQIYDPSANQWTAGPDMPWPAGACSSAIVGDRIVVFGGLINQETRSVGNCGFFDPAQLRWSNCSALVFPHNHMAGGTDGTSVYTFGGRGGGSFNTVQKFDVAGNKWTSLTAVLPDGGRAGMGAAPFFDGEFYVMGGEGGTSIQFHDRVDIFNPTTGVWRAGPPLPQKRHGIAPIAYNGSIYVACGGSQQFAFAPTTSLFALRAKVTTTTSSTTTSTIVTTSTTKTSTSSSTSTTSTSDQTSIGSTPTESEDATTTSTEASTISDVETTSTSMATTQQQVAASDSASSASQLTFASILLILGVISN